MTNPTTSTDPKEVAVSYFIPCPCGSDADATFGDFTFAATTIDVVPCTECRQTGVASYVLRKSYVLANAKPTVTGSRHADGLVTLGAI